MPHRAEDVKFAQVAVRWKYIDAAQANDCLRQQAEEGSTRPVSEVMVEKGHIRADQAEEIAELVEADKPRSLGGFELISKIAEGGMGAVYKAKQVSLERTVAVKILPKKLARDKQFVQRFLREAKLAAQFSHPNIVGALDVGEVEGVHYFAMEYVEGESLGVILRREEVMPEPRAVEIVTQIAKALECAGKHDMVHRDVKPDNILMDPEGTAKLADLGLARYVSDESTRLTQAGTAMGSPHYVSPEQASGETNIDIRADIYSLGATFYHIVTGSTPFAGPTPAVIMTKHLNEIPPWPRDVRSSVSEAASRVMMKMMAKDRKARYQSPTELIADLGRLARGEEPEAEGIDRTLMISAGELPGKKAGVSLWLITTFVLLAAVIAAAIFVFVSREAGTGKEELARAEALFEEGKLKQSKRVLAALLAKRPKGEVARGAKALLSELEELISEAERARKDREIADELAAVGGLLEQDQPEEALKRAKAGADKFPESREAFEEFASRAQAALDEKGLEEEFAAAVTGAEGLMAQRAYAEAAEAFSRALQIRDDAEVGERRGEALFLDARDRGEAAEKAGDVEGAIAAYAKALAMRRDPALAARVKQLRKGLRDAAERRRRLARVDELEHAGDFAGARKELKAAVDLASGDEREALVRRGDRLAEKEKTLELRLRAAGSHLESCHLTECIAETEKALALRPGDPEAERLKRSAEQKMSVENSVGMTLLYMPGGEFTMGGPTGDEDERPPHEVTLSHFYISKTEVTNRQYETFTPEHSSKRKYSEADDCPVVRVSWQEAKSFCEWLGAKEEAEYSLPTEAQWEYVATGAGSGSRYPWGPSPPDAGRCNIGWGAKEEWASDGHRYAAPAGSYPEGATPQGVVDLMGNVWEWCLDWYSPGYYKSAGARGPDPAGPESGTEKVMRGASFIDPLERCRSRYRSTKEPARKAANYGFRVVRRAK